MTLLEFCDKHPDITGFSAVAIWFVILISIFASVEIFRVWTNRPRK